MGSYEQACLTGFLCRLCSEMHKIVIHIYGAEGQSIGLAEKINEFLPVTITPHDPLPKTVCRFCLRRVQDHHVLIKTITQNNSKFSAAIRAAAIARLTTGPANRRSALAATRQSESMLPSSSVSSESAQSSVVYNINNLVLETNSRQRPPDEETNEADRNENEDSL